ncbi:PIN domain-containing protein [Novosphingobium colocasiae]|uniref:Ribonuclease VapC n=1 Tax=Novosphingobium colocasiae TaxID=1256513 RepID=A0A918PD66_9SPHN|nr:PIN domain-containing protein [Novosphingobium colocasiae]GGZ01201.1 VapC ribonuclease Y4jK [Novosphingobium colocasiae]
MILVDTNVFSELVKPVPEPAVVDWLFEHRTETALSAFVVAELNIGIRTTPGADKRRLLTAWLERLIAEHEGRTIGFDLAMARRWGTLSASVLIAGGRLGSQVFDTLIAAQAADRDLPLATRNVRHFQGVGLTLINPWEP